MTSEAPNPVPATEKTVTATPVSPVVEVSVSAPTTEQVVTAVLGGPATPPVVTAAPAPAEPVLVATSTTPASETILVATTAAPSAETVVAAAPTAETVVAAVVAPAPVPETVVALAPAPASASGTIVAATITPAPAQKLPYRLTYFPVKGRGEVARVLLALGGLEYEDEQIPLEKWAERKSQTALHFLPQLDIKCMCEPVNEKEATVSIAQSNSIERYLANKFALNGRNYVEAAQIDMIAETVNDWVNELSGLHRLPDGDEKKQKLEKAYKETAPANLKLIQKLYDQNQRVNENSGYLVGNGLTYADVKLVNAYDWLRESRDSALGDVPQLKTHYEKVRSNPKLKDYYAKSDKVKLAPYFKD